MNLDFSNPLVLILGGILFLAIIYFWNKSNARNQKERRNRNFRSNYYDRKRKLKEDMDSSTRK